MQLDNPDEQAAAIRREVATKEETLKDFHKVNKLFVVFLHVFSVFFTDFNYAVRSLSFKKCNNLDEKNNAKICGKRYGNIIY